MKKLKRVLMIVLMILVMSMTYYKAYAIKDNTKDYVSNDNNFIYSNSKTGTQSIDL